MTYLARGDTALSVSLTAVISLLSVVSLPLIVSLSILHFMDAVTAPELSIGRNIFGVFAITSVPVIIGMVTNRYAPDFAEDFERIARMDATVLFIVIVAGAIYAERQNLVEYLIQAGPVTLSLNLVMMGLTLALSKVGQLSETQQTAITLECGWQNSTLAIFVVLTLIGSREMMVPGAIYSLLMFTTAVAYVLFVVQRRRRET